MGFFRNGSPFLPFCESETDCDAARVAGSEVSLVPDGLLPVAPALLYSSVGATKDERDLSSLIGTGGGWAEGRLVFIGGGSGLDRVFCWPAGA